MNENSPLLLTYTFILAHTRGENRDENLFLHAELCRAKKHFIDYKMTSIRILKKELQIQADIYSKVKSV